VWVAAPSGSQETAHFGKAGKPFFAETVGPFKSFAMGMENQAYFTI
jgi:hypothetical protein